MDIYSLLCCVSLPYFDATVWRPVGFVFAMWEDGGGVMANHIFVVYILFVCIHLGDTVAFIPKNSLFPLARPSSPPIFIFIFAVSPLIARVPFCPLCCLSFFLIFM